MSRDPRSKFTVRPPDGLPHLRYQLPLTVALTGYLDDHGRRVLVVPGSTGQIHVVDGEQLTRPKYFALQRAYEALGGEPM